MTLTIDGDEIDSVVTQGQALVNVELSWTPAGPGTFDLRVVGSDGGGQTSGPAVARIRVGSDAEQPATTTTRPSERAAPDDGSTSTSELAAGETSTTDTSTRGATTSSTRAPTSTLPPTTGPTTTTTPPTTTTRPTTTTTPPCLPPTPTNTAPADGSETGSRTPTLEWSHRGCAPQRFQVIVTPGRELSPVEAGAFVDGAERRWTSTTLACGVHWFHVRAEGSAGLSAWSEPTSFTIRSRVC